MNQPVESVAAPAPMTGSAAALFSVLLEPRKTFESLKPTAPWILPFVVVLLTVTAFTYINWPYISDQQLEALQGNDRIPAEQKAEAISQLQAVRNSPGVKQVVGAPIVFAIGFPLFAGAWLLVGNVVAGGDGTFKAIWSAFNFTSMVLVVEMALKTLMIQMKQSMEVYTSLALLTPDLDTKAYLFLALDGVDLFSLWFFFVMAIGVSVMCKVKAQKATVVSLMTFAVWAFAIKPGWGLLIHSLTGF